MKKNIFILFSILLFSIMLTSCASNYLSYKQIIGYSTIKKWMENSGWNNYLYLNTNFSETEIREFQSFSQGYQYYIFASSTCLECAETLPYFFKLLEDANIAEGNIFLYGLDDYWQEPSGTYKQFKINEIPIVFAVNNDEKIRISKQDFSNFENLKQIFDGSR